MDDTQLYRLYGSEADLILLINAIHGRKSCRFLWIGVFRAHFHMGADSV